jgi:hypothetical protein
MLHIEDALANYISIKVRTTHLLYHPPPTKHQHRAKMSFAHLLTNNQQTRNPSNMTPANTQDEEAHIRNTLEINSFDLATLENYLISNAYIPASSDEDATKKAMYCLYERYLDEAPRFSRNPRLEGLFNPYPYDDAPVDDALGNTRSAREAQKHELESAKYNAVKDLIRIVATRNTQTSRTAEEALQAEQGKTGTAAEELKLEREKTDLLEKQVKSLQTKYEAVKLLVDESYDSELERIDNANNIRGPRRPDGGRAKEKAATTAVEKDVPRTPPPASTRRPAIYLPGDGRQAATATASKIAQVEEEKKRAAEEEEARVLRNRGRRQRPLPNPKSEPVVDTPEAISPVEILEPTGSLLDEHDGTIPEGIQKSRRRIRGRRKRSGKETAAASVTEESSETVAATPAPLLS